MDRRVCKEDWLVVYNYILKKNKFKKLNKGNSRSRYERKILDGVRKSDRGIMV